MELQHENSCGQGLDLDYVLNPYHNLLVVMGYTYSHSTRIIRAHDKGSYHHHTYKFGRHNVGVSQVENTTTWQWRTSPSSASSRHTTGYLVFRLEQHLKGKQRRYPELRLTCRPTFKVKAIYNG
jgi:hypothetical protein